VEAVTLNSDQLSRHVAARRVDQLADRLLA